MPNVVLPYRAVGSDFRSIGGLLSDFDAITNVVNGALDSSNVVNGGIPDAKLASPTNSVWRLITSSSWGALAGGSGQIERGMNDGLVSLVAADYAVPNKSLRLRQTIVMAVSIGNPPPVTCRVRPATGVDAGGNLTFSGAAVVSTVLDAPSVGVYKVDSEVAFPADGIYAQTIEWSGSTATIAVSTYLMQRSI